MKSYAPTMAGVAFVLTAIVSGSVLISPSANWQHWILNQSRQLIADTAFSKVPDAPALAVALVLGGIAAVVTLLVFARLEIIAAGWASEKSASALRKKNGELTVEEEMQVLVRKYGRR